MEAGGALLYGSWRYGQRRCRAYSSECGVGRAKAAVRELVKLINLAGLSCTPLVHPPVTAIAIQHVDRLPG